MTAKFEAFLDPSTWSTRDVSARGVRIRFLQGGSGPPLLLVHDFLESRMSWEDAVPFLVRRFMLIVPDLPGFGESEKPPPSRFAYDPNTFARALVDLLGAVGVNRAFVCGQGLGGAVAMAMAANHPEVVGKLVLLAPLVSDLPRDGAIRLAAAPIAGPIFYKQFYGRRLFRRHFEQKLRGTPSPLLRGRIDRLFEQFDTPAGREAAYATMMAMLDTRTLRAIISRVAASTLIGCGRGDASFTVAEGRKLARELQRGRIESFECGHFPAEECPEAFARAATAFLEDKLSNGAS